MCHVWRKYQLVVKIIGKLSYKDKSWDKEKSIITQGTNTPLTIQQILKTSHNTFRKPVRKSTKKYKKRGKNTPDNP